MRSGTFVSLLGHNGSGKSTLLKTINGELPFMGSIFFGDKPVRYSRKQPALPYPVTYLSQESFVQFPILMEDLVVMGRYRHTRFLHPYSTKDYDMAFDIMNRLGIVHLRKKPVPDVSGGERQLAWIAQALLQDSSIYLLDEPTQNLDLYHRHMVMKLFNELSEQKGKTIIFSTHDLELLSDINGKIINLSENKALEENSAQNIQKHKQILLQRPSWYVS